jgi:hypothetical protein
MASCNLGTSPGGGGTEGEGLSGVLQDPDGRTVAGALVRVFPEPRATLGKSALAAEAVFDSVYSDSRGRFKFDSLPDGHYGLRSSVKRGDTTLVLMLREILYDGKEKSLGTHTLVVGGKLRMKIRSGTDASNPQHPLPGTQCAVVGLPYVFLADSSGVCMIDGLPPGQYAVRLSYPGYADVVTLPIEVRPGQSSGEGPWDLGAAGPVRYYPASPSTLAHWTFDARDTLTAAFPDVSGNGIPLQGYGAIPLAASPFGKSAVFNGSSYLSTAEVEAGLSGKDGRYLTVEARVRLTQYPSPLNQDSAATVLGTSKGYNLLVRSNGSLAIQMSVIDTTIWPITAAWSLSGAVPLNRWVNLAVSVDKQKLQAYAFIDGVPIPLYNRQGHIPNMPDPTVPLYVGGFPGMNRPFVGEIDELRVSDTLVFGEGPALARLDTAPAFARAQFIAVADAGLSAPVPGNADNNGLSDLNSGADVHFSVGAYDMASAYRGVVRFTLPAGTSPGEISRAVIRMRVHSWVEKSVSGVVRIDAHRILKDWKEGTGRGTGYFNSAVFDGVTARERYWTSGGTSGWSQNLIGLNDMDAAAAPSASASVTSRSGTVLEWDVTDLAREWAADPSKNFGVVLASAFPASNALAMDFPRLHTREAPGGDSLKPTLILNGAAPVASEVNITADADVTISYAVPGNQDVQGYGRQNRGKETTFGPGTYDMTATSRALARFPVPGQYAGRIASAKIRLTPSGWTTKNTKRPVKIDLHRMLKSWKEGQGWATPTSASVDGATGLERFWGSQNGAEDWTQPLVGLDSVDALAGPSATLTKPAGSLDPWEFDVTTLARAWASDTTRNFGVLLASEIPASNAETWD